MKSSLRDNRPNRGSVGQFLRDAIEPDAQLSFVSAYFTAALSLMQAIDTVRGKLTRLD